MKLIKIKLPAILNRIPKFSDSGLIGLFFISPILTLPYILRKSYEGEKTAQILLSCFLGLLSICFVPPRGDLYRLYLGFIEISNHDFNHMLQNLRFDIALPLLNYIFSRLNFDFEIIRLIAVGFSYILFFKLFNKLKGTVSNEDIPQLFLYCLLSVPFMSISLGIRYGLAACIVSYVALKRYIVGEKLTLNSYILLFLGPVIHFGIIWFSFLIILLQFCPNFLLSAINKIILIGGIIVAYLISDEINDILQLLIFSEKTEQLVNHYSGKGIYGERYVFHNFIGSIPEYYNYFLVYVIIFIYLIKIPTNRANILLGLIFIVWAFTHSLFSISGRIVSVILCLAPLYIFKNKAYTKLFINLLIIGSLAVIIINWRAYTISNSFLIIFSPLIILSWGYDQEWLSTYVEQNGTLKIYIR